MHGRRYRAPRREVPRYIFVLWPDGGLGTVPQELEAQTTGQRAVVWMREFEPVPDYEPYIGTHSNPRRVDDADTGED